MTQDEIIEMAEQAGVAFSSDDYPDIWGVHMHVGKQEIETFAKLVEDKALAQRTWVGLTDDEHCDIWYKESLDWMEYGKAIEAKLKQKNGYAEEKQA